jgi:hypothetical protein
MAALGEQQTPAANVRVSDTQLKESLSEHLKKTVEGYKQGDNEGSLPEDGLGGDQEKETPEAEAARLAKEKAENDKNKPDGDKLPEVESTEDGDKGETGEDEHAEEDSDKVPEEEVVDGEEKEEETEPEPGKPVPYERFNQVLERRNELQQELEYTKPVVENYNRITGFCQKYSITPDQFEKVMRVQALLNTNPEAALQEILPIVESLQGFAGNKLPKDLQDKVDAGKMDLEDARETAKLRAMVKHRETMAKVSEEDSQRQTKQRYEQECSAAAMTWEKAKRTSDPDYLPKKSDSVPDGKWEDVRDKYLALLSQIDSRGQLANKVDNVAQMVALMERAYRAVDEKYKRFNGKVRSATRRPLRSTSSGGGEKLGKIEEAKTMGEAIRIRLAQSAQR